MLEEQDCTIEDLSSSLTDFEEEIERVLGHSKMCQCPIESIQPPPSALTALTDWFTTSAFPVLTCLTRLCWYCRWCVTDNDVHVTHTLCPSVDFTTVCLMATIIIDAKGYIERSCGLLHSISAIASTYGRISSTGVPP